jgi:hypothetical protein
MKYSIGKEKEYHIPTAELFSFISISFSACFGTSGVPKSSPGCGKGARWVVVSPKVGISVHDLNNSHCALKSDLPLGFDGAVKFTVEFGSL